VMPLCKYLMYFIISCNCFRALEFCFVPVSDRICCMYSQTQVVRNHFDRHVLPADKRSQCVDPVALWLGGMDAANYPVDAFLSSL
jgi:hypothetical protein